MSDDKIIELIRKGDTDKAFLALYKHFPMMRKMILSKGGKKEDAEDIFQEALIILYRRVNEPQFKLSSKISTYLYSICRFLWKDELKKRNKIPATGFEENIDTAEENAIAEAVEKESKIKIAEKVLTELGDRCRELLIMFYSGTMKLKDIATKMGYTSENSAKNQKYKCLEGAKKKLAEVYQQ